MDVRDLYDRAERDPKYFPLFNRIWQVLTMAPSNRHNDEEDMVHLAFDAFDYLQADGDWHVETDSGTTRLRLDGNKLEVEETDNKEYRYDHTFTIS